MSLNPKITKEGTTYYLNWTPDPTAEGYSFVTPNGQSRTFSPTLSKTKIGKNLTEPVVASVAAIDLTIRPPEPASYPAVVPPTPTNSPPRYNVHVTPNQYDVRDGPAANYQLCWLDHYSDNGPRTLDRLISDEWWMEWEFLISTDWDVTKQGDWGRPFNSHVDWTAVGAEDVTSAQAVDYMGGKMVYHSEPGGNRDWTIADPLVKGVPHKLRWKSVLGRVDGGTPRPGSAVVWLDGAKVVDTGPINTIYRWKNGSLESHQWLWTGFYSRNVQKTLPFEMTFCRFGKSEAEMLADKGWKASPNGFRLSDHLIPGKVDYGPATAVLIP